MNEAEAPQELDSTIDSDLGVSITLAEGYLDGPYDFAYSRIEKYMDTSASSTSTNIKYGMKAQTLTFAPGNQYSISQILLIFNTILYF